MLKLMTSFWQYLSLQISVDFKLMMEFSGLIEITFSYFFNPVNFHVIYKLSLKDSL